MPNEKTLILVKPDGVQRGLIGDVIGRLEKTGLKIIGIKFIQISEELAGKHYAEHKDKPFFSGLVKFITSSPVVALVLEGNNAISITRKTMGATNPVDSPPGTKRGDFAIDLGRNIIHGSANDDDAKREVDLFFDKNELCQYSKSNDAWVTE